MWGSVRCSSLAAGADESIECCEQDAERAIQPNQHVLHFVTVGTEVVTDFVEGRETDPEKICRSDAVEPNDADGAWARIFGVNVAAIVTAAMK